MHRVEKPSPLLYIPAVFLFLAISSFMALSSNIIAAEIPLISDVNLSVPASCGMTSTLDSPHSATITPGVYKDNIGTTTFNILCNDPGGFALYAIGYTDQTYGKTTLTATINGSVDHAHDISTSTATSGTTSSWAMKIFKDGTPNNITIDNSYDDYNVIPTEYTKVASFTPTTTELVSQGTIKSTYASYMSSTQHTGTYDGKVKYTLVHPSSELPPTYPVTTEPGKISYNPNAPGVVDSMGDQSASSNSAVDLWPSNFKRSGYGFAGWNTEHDYSGTTYGPMETITTPDLSTTGLSLYAVWIKSAGDLQGWQGCDSLASGAVTALTDTRDDNVYAVAKLADGKCWMIENLRLGSTAATTLTPTDSNITSGIALPASTNTFTQSNYTTIEMSAKNTLEAPTNMTTPTNAEVYSYGNYYSWPAAIGSTTAYSTNNQSVSTSVCPSGWHLPKGGQNTVASGQSGDFYVLTTTLMGGEAPNNPDYGYAYYQGTVNGVDVGAKASGLLRTYPNNILYSGGLSGSSFNVRGSLGIYWSSTVYSSDDSYYLRFLSSYVYPGTDYNTKYNGFSVRCVADPPKVTISDAYAKTGKTKQNGYYKMQDMDDNICGIVNALDEPGQTQLIDTRDNKVYWATKLKDGKCWMTQNLDLDLSTSKTLTPADTDIPANWTPDKSTYPTSTTTWDTSSTRYNIQQSYDPGNKIWNGVTTSSAGTTINNMTQGTNQHYHLGNYYNWSAAVAMNNTSSYTTRYTDVNQSICPKGWMLPKNGNITTAGSFQYLVNQYNWASDSMTNPNMWSAPLYFPLAGYWGGSSNNNDVAYSGYFWSSVVSSSSHAHYMNGYYNGTVYSVDVNARSGGYSVRCVSR